MLFLVSLDIFRTPIRVYVAEDGKLYCAADDVGLFLGYKDFVHLRMKWGRTLHLRSWPNGGVFLLKTQVIPVENVPIILGRRNPVAGRLFMRAFFTGGLNGRVIVSPNGQTSLVLPWHGATPVREWIAEYVRSVKSGGARSAADAGGWCGSLTNSSGCWCGTLANDSATPTNDTATQTDDSGTPTPADGISADVPIGSTPTAVVSTPAEVPLVPADVPLVSTPAPPESSVRPVA